MESINKRTSTNSKKSHLSDAATQFMNEGKKFVHEIYEDGRHRVHDAQQHAKEYSDEAVEVVRKNPMTSVLVAAGIGFLLHAILRK